MSQDTISLTLEPRKVLGKQVKQLRNQGTIPAVIHDHGKESVVVQGDYIQLTKVFKQAGKHHPIEIKTGDKSYVALIKSATFDPKKHLLTHVVFNAVDRNQKVEADVPVKPRYDDENEASPAERNGLIVLSQLETVQVKAIPSSIPDVLEYNAEKLVEVGDSVTVADLVAPAGVEIETDPNHAVATVYEPSALAAANEATAGDAEDEGEASEGDETEGAESADGEKSSDANPDSKEQPAEKSES